jgi:hypothetical protein
MEYDALKFNALSNIKTFFRTIYCNELTVRCVADDYDITLIITMRRGLIPRF